MAYEENMKTVTMIAGADLSAVTNQYKFVKLNSTANTIVLCGDGEDAFGVLQDTPQSGEAACVCVGGITKVYAGATFNPGVVISSGAGGVANTSANGDYMLGKAVLGGADGVITSMLFQPTGIDPT